MDNTRNIIYCRKISFINYFCHADGTKLFVRPVRAVEQRNTIVRSPDMSNDAKMSYFSRLYLQNLMVNYPPIFSDYSCNLSLAFTRFLFNFQY